MGKTSSIPPAWAAWAESWRRCNPGWDYRLWTDQALLEFVSAHYPALLEVYRGYGENISRSDAARYMLLHHFGGVYADLDAVCLQAFEPLVAENRIVLCKEPRTHWPT